MAYKSKEKLLEIGTGNFSYCTIDPKTGVSCSKHFHAEKQNLNKKEAERLRKLGEELIEMSEDKTVSLELSPEEVYKTLGMKKPKTVSHEDANAWMEANIVEILTNENIKTEDGKWLTPDNAEDIECKECGNKIQLVKLANGLTTWHHPNHAELDTISRVSFHPENNAPYSINHVSSNPDGWSEEDVEMVKANAAIGSSLGYTWQGPQILSFGKVGSEGQSVEDYKNSNHMTIPAPHCYNCGSQKGTTVKKENGGMFKKFTYRETETCINCGNIRVLSQY